MKNLSLKNIIVNGTSISWMQSKIIKSNRKSILFVHGIASQGKHWLPLIENLHNYYNIYVLDRPGYGKSNTMEKTTLQEYTDFLKKIIIKMDIPTPFIYVGHSMGGYLGIKLSLEHIYFEKLILISPFIKFTPNNGLLCDAKKCKSLVCKSVANSFTKSTDLFIIKDYLADVDAMNDVSIWTDFCIIANSEIKKEELRNIGTYVYILHALDDHVISIRKSLSMLEYLNNSELDTIDYGGHNFFISYPVIASSCIENCIRK